MMNSDRSRKASGIVPGGCALERNHRLAGPTISHWEDRRPWTGSTLSLPTACGGSAALRHFDEADGQTPVSFEQARKTREMAIGDGSNRCISYGTLTKLTTLAGRGPEAHPWPPAVLGTMVLSSMLVRSTIAKVVAPKLASSATA